MTTTLSTRPLGRSGLGITRVGFGSWAVGGGGWSFGWGPQDDAESLATMRHALERGVNWIDTAAVYGLGHSEELVGRLVHELPPGERPLIFTKCGMIWDEQHPMAAPRQVLKPESIRRECEASLRRLGVERIDLYQFHWPDETGTFLEDSWAAMVKLVEEGKVRAAGVSNFDTRLLDRCEAIRHVDLSPASARTEPGPAGRAAADRGPARHVGVVHRHRVDPRVAGSDRRHRRGAHGGAGGRLDRSGHDPAHPDGPRRDRVRDRADQGGGGAGADGRSAGIPAKGRAGSCGSITETNTGGTHRGIEPRGGNDGFVARGRPGTGAGTRKTR